jgi:hypothetical protein
MRKDRQHQERAMSDRVLKFSEAEFTAAVRRKVEALFEANRSSPNPSREIPIIGELLWVDYHYNPRAPAEAHADLIDLAVKAVIARNWFESQLPPWMQPLPLPLNQAERIALNNTGDRRLQAVANYAPARYFNALRQPYDRRKVLHYPPARCARPDFKSCRVNNRTTITLDFNHTRHPDQIRLQRTRVMINDRRLAIPLSPRFTHAVATP